MIFTDEYPRSAIKAAFGNMELVEKSEQCSCYHCLKTFPAAEIDEWIEEDTPPNTACCPYCGIDSVLCSATEFPIVDTEFLTQLKRFAS